jgi:transcriptional regulator with XRE-family HTH domain
MSKQKARSIGEVLAARVRRYRDAQGLTQEDVAGRTTELGHPMNRVTLAKIEAGKTRASNASLIDVLVLASALDVPPALLFLPVGEEVEVVIAPNLRTDPVSAVDWLSGGVPPLRPWDRPVDLTAWAQNTRPLQMLRGLRVREEAMELAAVMAERLATDEARRDLDRARAALDSWKEAMTTSGLLEGDDGVDR